VRTGPLIHQIEDATVLRIFPAEFSIDADWQIDLNPPSQNGVWGDVWDGDWVRYAGARRDR
jgi:hypothetical protein